MRAFVDSVSFVSRALGVLAALLLFSAVLSVTHMVFVRYALNQSTVWQTEYTAYAVVAATFLGAPWTLIVRGHVNVDLLQISVPRGPRIVLEMLAGLASLAFVLLLTYAAWLYIEEAWVNSWQSETVWGIPLWRPILPMLVGSGWLAVQYVAEMVRLILDGPPDADEGDALSRQNQQFHDTAHSGEARQP